MCGVTCSPSALQIFLRGRGEREGKVGGLYLRVLCRSRTAGQGDERRIPHLVDGSPAAMSSPLHQPMWSLRASGCLGRSALLHGLQRAPSAAATALPRLPRLLTRACSDHAHGNGCSHDDHFTVTTPLYYVNAGGRQGREGRVAGMCPHMWWSARGRQAQRPPRSDRLLLCPLPPAPHMGSAYPTIAADALARYHVSSSCHRRLNPSCRCGTPLPPPPRLTRPCPPAPSLSDPMSVRLCSGCVESASSL